MIKQLRKSTTQPMIEKAMPYLIEGTYTPSWAETIDTNKKFLVFLKTRNPKLLKRHKVSDSVWELYTTQVNGNQLIWLEDSDVIQYCVEVKSLKLEGLVELNTVCQTSVWRNKEFMLSGFAKWVFFNILMPKNGNILSDCYQYLDGKRFWHSRIQEVLTSKKKFFVYAVSIYGESAPHVYGLEHVTGLKRFDEFYTDVDDLSGQYTRLLISDRILHQE
jgi:hypothetical protein